MKNPDEKFYKYCPNCRLELIRKNIDNRKRLICSSCGFIFWSNPKPVVSILISKDNKVLLVKRAKEPLKDYWCLPGGFINYDEEPEDAVVREAKEEIGVKVSILGFVGVYRIDNDPRGLHIDLIYNGNYEGDIKLSNEHSDYKFFSLSGLPEKIAYKHQKVIEDWVKGK